MRKLTAVTVVSVALFAFGCSTAYVASDFSVSGGFSETRLSPDTWRVLVEGNGLTSRGEVEQYALRRCAELTLEQGKRYFILRDHDAWMSKRRSDDGSIVTSPRNEAVMTVVSEKAADTFDAVTIIEDTNEAARGRLSERAQTTLAELSR